MKRFLDVVLVALLAFFAYQYFFRKPKQVVITKEVSVDTKEQYGAELRKIHDTVFADLDTASPNPTANLQKLRGSVEYSLQQGAVDPSIAHAVLRLCELLSAANLERESREFRLKEIRGKDYDSLTRRGSLQTKQFFESAEQRKWKVYVTSTRPRCELLLKQLKVRERDQ